MMNSLVGCPHTLDLSRLRVLEAKAREYNAQALAAQQELASLERKLRDAEKHVRNWKDRLSHKLRSGSSETNFDDSPHPTDVASIRSGLAAAETRVAEIEALISKEERRILDLSEKSSAGFTLIDRCKKAVQELSEDAA